MDYPAAATECIQSLTLGELRRDIIIPVYQRRYIWGKHRAHTLADELRQAYLDGTDKFIQAITLSGSGELIDGQQRLIFFNILLGYCGVDVPYTLEYPQGRPAKTDYRHFDTTAEVLLQTLEGIDLQQFGTYILSHVRLSLIVMPIVSKRETLIAYTMMNAAKSPMHTPDIIKADIIRMISDPTAPGYNVYEVQATRNRFAGQWNDWVMWWNRHGHEILPNPYAAHPLELLLTITLSHNNDLRELTHAEFTEYIARTEQPPHIAAKMLCLKIRATQCRFDEAMANPETYNRIRAIIMLQRHEQRMTFIRRYFADMSIDTEELERYYKLSFLGLSIDEIASERADEIAADRFDDVLAALSMSDVYHSADAKRECYNLLLRLNIDEDTKLGRKFDFTIWDDRSLEHIYSKSKVWHTGNGGECLDGNDNVIDMSRRTIAQHPEYISRDSIVNHDGAQLSEHCIGNLVLLYGANNSDFGNAAFEKKKTMFLNPANSGVFRSRNLLHSVCVFARDRWDAAAIVENYNRMLKNFKQYYQNR